MDSETNPPDWRGSSTATIIRDVSCRSCGYNLRGLVASGACPECAAAVQDSLSPDDLLHANSRWLRQVLVGLRIALAGLCLPAVAIALLFLFAVMALPHPFSGPPERIVLGIFGASVLILMGGILLCTGRESRIDATANAHRVRQLTRLCAATIALLIFLSVVLYQAYWRMMPGANTAIGFVGTVLSVAYPMWLNHLFQRASTGTPEESASVASWLAIACSCCLGFFLASIGLNWANGLGIATVLLLPIALAYFGILILATWRCAIAVAYDERLARERASQSNGAK